MFTGLTSSLLKEGDTLNTLHTAVYQDLPTTVRLLQRRDTPPPPSTPHQ